MTAAFDLSGIGEQIQKGANGNLVSFGHHPVKNEAKSQEAERPIFDDVEYIQIICPGQRDVIHRPVTDMDRREYAAQYKAFKENGDQDAASGTPLSLLPGMTKSMVEELRYFHCRTIEQLAAMTDGNAQNFAGLHEYRKKAQAYLDAAKSNAGVAKLQRELEERDNRIAALEKQMQDVISKSERKSKG